ncbi:hypothetical protein ACFWPG_35730, partial [Streptomyces sp. NPDC058451]
MGDDSTDQASPSRHMGTCDRVRLNRGGNRSINHALHMIAVTQVRRGGEGADYFAKQLARGKTPKEAVRLLRRHVSDRVFRALLTDEDAAQPTATVPDLAALPAA